jgi:hypothetical protein
VNSSRDAKSGTGPQPDRRGEERAFDEGSPVHGVLYVRVGGHTERATVLAGRTRYKFDALPQLRVSQSIRWRTPALKAFAASQSAKAHIVGCGSRRASNRIGVDPPS